jgi:FKBP-type peptidyl-prolyl cis-trans isomerase
MCRDRAIITAMTFARLGLLLVATALAASACQLKEEPGDSSIPAPADVKAPPADALRTPSGLASKVIIVGLGNSRPTPTSTVTVHYTGWTTDGKMFESSYQSGKPVTFPVGQVIPGWQEALQLMVAGEKRRFWIPGHLAYDSNPDPTAPKGMLVFEIELLTVR